MLCHVIWHVKRNKKLNAIVKIWYSICKILNTMGRIEHMLDNEKKTEKETEKKPEAVQAEAAEQVTTAEAEVKDAASTVEEDAEPFVVKLPDKKKKPKRKERREKKKNRILNIIRAAFTMMNVLFLPNLLEMGKQRATPAILATSPTPRNKPE